MRSEPKDLDRANSRPRSLVKIGFRAHIGYAKIKQCPRHAREVGPMRSRKTRRLLVGLLWLSLLSTHALPQVGA
jgi:hypothetical protein